jgi:hypothetical protein
MPAEALAGMQNEVRIRTGHQVEMYLVLSTACINERPTMRMWATGQLLAVTLDDQLLLLFPTQKLLVAVPVCFITLHLRILPYRCYNNNLDIYVLCPVLWATGLACSTLDDQLLAVWCSMAALAADQNQALLLEMHAGTVDLLLGGYNNSRYCISCICIC